ncbi:MAG: O-antigen/teichoic acid export membrane protein [Bradymonadia bacterium]|jgi:O-antigen/teichoic acid export membrane protein
MLRNIGSNWVISVLNIVLVLFLTRFLIFELGEEAYGVWLVIAALTSYLELLRGGLPAATVRYLSEAVGAKDSARVDSVVASATSLYAMMSFVAAIVGCLLLLVFHWKYDVPDAMQPSATAAFVIAMLTMSFGFIAHLPTAVMEANDDFITKNIVRLVGLFFKGSLTVGLLWWRADVMMVALAVAGVTTVELVLGAYLARTRYHARLVWGARSPEVVGGLFRYSAYVLLLAVGFRLSFQSDALVIGARGDLDDVAVYSVANSLLLYLSEFVAAVAVVVMPLAAKLREQGEEEALRELLLTSSKTSITVALLIGGYLLWMGPAFLAWWLHPEFAAEAARSLRILTVSFFVLLPVTGAAVPVLMGVGNVAIPALAYLLMGIVNVGVSVALVPSMGIEGAAWGTAVPNVVFAVFVLVFTCRATGTSVSRYVSYVFVRPLIGYVLPGAGLAWAALVLGAEGLFGLVTTGIAYVLCFAMSWLLWTYRNDGLQDWRETRIGRLILRFYRRS